VKVAVGTGGVSVRVAVNAVVGELVTVFAGVRVAVTVPVAVTILEGVTVWVLVFVRAGVFVGVKPAQ
jgi:hypothetical protein